VTCCSQVFDADGGGMQFVAYGVGEGSDLRNPYLSREQMRLVMARSLALYQDRHAGGISRRLVVHKQTPFTSDEVAGCIDAWAATSELACVTLERPHWRGVQLAARNRPGYAVDRGTTLALDGHSALVWVAGNARTATLTGHGNFLQGKKGTPRPLLLTRHAGCGPLTDLAEQVLALSKMNWNNNALYDALPCTIRYAQTLARRLSICPACCPCPTTTACSCSAHRCRACFPQPTRCARTCAAVGWARTGAAIRAGLVSLAVRPPAGHGSCPHWGRQYHALSADEWLRRVGCRSCGDRSY